MAQWVWGPKFQSLAPRYKVGTDVLTGSLMKTGDIDMVDRDRGIPKTHWLARLGKTKSPRFGESEEDIQY